MKRISYLENRKSQIKKKPRTGRVEAEMRQNLTERGKISKYKATNKKIKCIKARKS
jgi:hypothetical protein